MVLAGCNRNELRIRTFRCPDDSTGDGITLKEYVENTMKRRLLASLLATLVSAGSAATATAAESRSFCVWDPLGASGPYASHMKDIRVEALAAGFDLQIKPYTDEAIAANDFRAGQCDAVLLTDIAAHKFNKFTGSLVALGAIPTDEDLKVLLQTLAQPKAASLMVHGDYEVAGIFPAGGIYVYTRDRKIHSVDTIQGKKIATFDYDPSSVTMVRHVGASPVPATTSNFAGMFNNGSVDVAYAPALAYKPMEMYKGVEPNGGVYNYKFAQMTHQMVVHRAKFTPEFTQKTREIFFNRFDKFMDQVKAAEADIPANYWIQPTKEDGSGFDSMLRGVRVALKDEGHYDPRTLNLMLKV